MNSSQYLDLFVEECREHIQSINDELLKLEQSPDDTEAINNIFRNCHTIKGMSAAMGFEKIMDLSHRMENLLEQLRAQTICFTPEMADLLFQGADLIKEMVDVIAGGEDKDFDITLLLESIGNMATISKTSEYVEKDTAIEIDAYERRLINEAKKRSMNVFQIEIDINQECLMKSVRAFMVFNSLQKIGEIIKSIPHPQELEQDENNSRLIILFITSYSQNEVLEIIDSISEIRVTAFSSINNIFQEENSRKSILIRGKNLNSQTVRVDIGKLDKLMNLVGELVINKSRLEQILKQANYSLLKETVMQIDKTASDLQSVVMSTRMVSIEQVFNRFPRMVRDLAKELGKQVELAMFGEETELDRKVIDEIGDPLVHLVRNSIDHGIESPEERTRMGKSPYGTLELHARQDGNSIFIIVKDDGRGLQVDEIKRKALEKGLYSQPELDSMDDASLINLIFSPGFSTASKITDISGRGVGLDVVKAKINALNGTILVENLPQQGTAFTIKLPLTLAIIQALLVRVTDEIYAIPLANINETTVIHYNQIKNLQNEEVILLRGNILPLVRLAQVLRVPGPSDNSDRLYVVVVKRDHHHIGLVVDELMGLHEIVISSLGRLLNGIPGLSGAAILGDGRVSLILDISTLY